MFDIQENLKKLPDKPGVYIHRDINGNVIYVGKAVSLKRRVRQYFQSQANMHPKVRAMVSHIAEFEYITTDSEMEALILENNLIKKYMPRYNVLLRDDKTYPYIKITTNEDFPRILKTRRVVEDGSKYFGPYSDVTAVNETIDLLNEIYSLKRCSSKSFPKGFRPCLNHHIGQCDGICAGLISKEDYRKKIDDIVNFLRGNTKDIKALLTEKMMHEAELLNFEKAASYRDRIAAVDKISEKQKVVLSVPVDMDMILTARSGERDYAIIFFVRDGKLSGRESFPLDDGWSLDDGSQGSDWGYNGLDSDSKPGEEASLRVSSKSGENADLGSEDLMTKKKNMENNARGELTGAFIKQYYSAQRLVPREIAVEYMPEDADLLSRWLSSMSGTIGSEYSEQKRAEASSSEYSEQKRAGAGSSEYSEQKRAKDANAHKFGIKNHPVKIFTPQKGEKRGLMDMARRDVIEMMKTLDRRTQSEAERRAEIRKTLNSVLGNYVSSGKDIKWRIEAYDISNTNGVDSVGGMVVFEDGTADRRSYRKFKIKTVDGPDDYSSMQEVIYRRLRRAQKGDAGFTKMPDVLFIDGGRGHVNAVRQVLDAMKINIPAIGMVKDDNHRTRGLIIGNEEYDLKKNLVLFRYVTKIQDEVHRFAIDYHHGLRNSSLSRSQLDEIPGIGTKRKRELLKAFGSIEKISAASEEDLAKIEGMNQIAAKNVYSYFRKKRDSGQ